MKSHRLKLFLSSEYLPDIQNLVENIQSNICWKGADQDILFPKEGIMVEYDSIQIEIAGYFFNQN